MIKTVMEALLKKVDAEEPAALVTVIDTGGPTPGKTGFKMLVDAQGATVGTVGGGLLEATVIEEARAAVGAGVSRLATYRLDNKEAGGMGMACGAATQECGAASAVILFPATVWALNF